MKILFVTLGILQDKGGIGTFNQHILSVLEEFVETKIFESATIISLWDVTADFGHNYSKLRIFGFHRNKLKMAFSYLRELISGNYTNILFGHVYLYFLFPFSKLLSRTSIQTLFVHGVEVWEKPSTIKRLFVDKFINIVASVSNFTADRMAGSYKLPKTRFFILPNSIELKDTIKPTLRKTDGKTILTVSRLSKASKHKGIDLALESMNFVFKQFPGAKYVIVGDGSWKKELEELSKSLGVDKKVVFLGTMNDIERDTQYELADIFLLPSTGEGFGIVFLEAWKFHLPIVTSNQGAAPEVVRHGVDGFCVDPLPEKISEVICTLLDNPALRNQFGESGYNRVRDFYTHDNFRIAFLKMFYRYEDIE